MRAACLPSVVALFAATAAIAQTTPFDPGAVAPAPVPVAPAATPVVAPVAAPDAPLAVPALKPYQKVEVEDPNEPGAWDPCTIVVAYQGAYEVNCNGARRLERDTKVRAVGGQPVGQTTAIPVAGPPYKRGMLLLVSKMGLPDDWRLCVIEKNSLVESNTYVVNCGASSYHVLPKWVREDPDAPG